MSSPTADSLQPPAAAGIVLSAAADRATHALPSDADVGMYPTTAAYTNAASVEPTMSSCDTDRAVKWSASGVEAAEQQTVAITEHRVTDVTVDNQPSIVDEHFVPQWMPLYAGQRVKSLSEADMYRCSIVWNFVIDMLSQQTTALAPTSADSPARTHLHLFLHESATAALWKYHSLFINKLKTLKRRWRPGAKAWSFSQLTIDDNLVEACKQLWTGDKQLSSDELAVIGMHLQQELLLYPTIQAKGRRKPATNAKPLQRPATCFTADGTTFVVDDSVVPHWVPTYGGQQINDLFEDSMYQLSIIWNYILDMLLQKTAIATPSTAHAASRTHLHVFLHEAARPTKSDYHIMYKGVIKVLKRRLVPPTATARVHILKRKLLDDDVLEACRQLFAGQRHLNTEELAAVEQHLRQELEVHPTVQSTLPVAPAPAVLRTPLPRSSTINATVALSRAVLSCGDNELPHRVHQTPLLTQSTDLATEVSFDSSAQSMLADAEMPDRYHLSLAAAHNVMLAHTNVQATLPVETVSPVVSSTVTATSQPPTANGIVQSVAVVGNAHIVPSQPTPANHTNGVAESRVASAYLQHTAEPLASSSHAINGLASPTGGMDVSSLTEPSAVKPTSTHAAGATAAHADEVVGRHIVPSTQTDAALIESTAAHSDSDSADTAAAIHLAAFEREVTHLAAEDSVLVDENVVPQWLPIYGGTRVYRLSEDELHRCSIVWNFVVDMLSQKIITPTPSQAGSSTRTPLHVYFYTDATADVCLATWQKLYSSKLKLFKRRWAPGAVAAAFNKGRSSRLDEELLTACKQLFTGQRQLTSDELAAVNQHLQQELLSRPTIQPIIKDDPPALAKSAEQQVTCFTADGTAFSVDERYVPQWMPIYGGQKITDMPEDDVYKCTILWNYVLDMLAQKTVHATPTTANSPTRTRLHLFLHEAYPPKLYRYRSVYSSKLGMVQRRWQPTDKVSMYSGTPYDELLAAVSRLYAEERQLSDEELEAVEQYLQQELQAHPTIQSSLPLESFNTSAADVTINYKRRNADRDMMEDAGYCDDANAARRKSALVARQALHDSAKANESAMDVDSADDRFPYTWDSRNHRNGEAHHADVSSQPSPSPSPDDDDDEPSFSQLLARQLPLRPLFPPATLLNLSLTHDTIPVELRCVICMDVMKATTIIKACLHRFCNACILHSLRVVGRFCPTCRTPVSTHRECYSDKRYDLIIQAIVGDVDRFNKRLQAEVAADLSVLRPRHVVRTAPTVRPPPLKKQRMAPRSEYTNGHMDVEQDHVARKASSKPANRNVRIALQHRLGVDQEQIRTSNALLISQLRQYVSAAHQLPVDEVMVYVRVVVEATAKDSSHTVDIRCMDQMSLKWINDHIIHGLIGVIVHPPQLVMTYQMHNDKSFATYNEVDDDD